MPRATKPCVLICLAMLGCSGEEFSQSGGAASGGTAGAASGGTAGAASGGAAGTASGGVAGTTSGGAGGSVPTGGTGGGTGGASATCPGTASGCVIDWAGVFGQPGNTDGVGAAARFQALGGITGDGKSIWVGANDAIRRIDIATATVTTFAGASGQASHLDAVGTAARFSGIGGLATDGKTLWVAESSNQVIRAIDIASATVSTLAGSPGQAGTADGIGSGALLNGPRGIVWSGTYLFITETTHNAVRRIDPKTGQVVTLAGGNGQGAADGTGAVAQFWAPRALGFFASTVWVSDTENHRLRKLTPGSDKAGTQVSSPLGSAAGLQDGVGTAAMFRRLRGVANDGKDLLVADSDNFVLRKVELPSLAVTTIAGTGSPGHAEGVGTLAVFNKPTDVHFDPGTGDLFILETDVIRRMYYK